MPPAARLTDPTAHGAPLAPGIGSTDVLIGYMPAWRALIDQHMCPAVSITGPDGVGMVMMGSPTVLIDYMMACRMGDIVVEIPGLAMGPMNPIVMGCPTVMIGEVGMGGAGSAVGAGMGAAKTSAVACPTDDPPTLSVPVAASANIAPPASFYQSLAATSSPTAAAAASGGNDTQDPDPSKTKEIVCGLTAGSVHVHCQHGGRTPKDGLLEVVPSLAGGDTITCNSGIIGTCGQHPIWVIGGYWDSQKIGTATSFNARSFQVVPNSLSSIPLWLADSDPHIYNVSVSSCSGPSYSFEIHAYPSDSQEVSINLNIYKATLDPIIEKIASIVGLLVEPPRFKWLEGSGKASSQWKEDDKSNLAFYNWQVSIGFNPLFGAEFRLPLGPSALPEALGKFGNAGFFLEVKGEINIQLEGGQVAPPGRDAGHFDAKADCSVIFAVGGSAFLGAESDPVISVEVSIQTGITAEATGTLEDHRPVAPWDIKIGGLKGDCVFHFLFYDDKSECTFFDATEIWKGTFDPFASKDSAANGEHG